MNDTLGKRIISHRKKMGLTQDKLAEMMGVTPQAVSKWENDQSCPDISALPQLADIFSTTTDELLGRAALQNEAYSKPADEEPVCDTASGQGIEWYYEGGKRDALALACFVLLVGALTFLSRLYNWDVSFWNILWPCAIIILGLRGFFHKFTFFSAGCFLLGCYFLLDKLHLIKWDIAGELIFPVLIFVLGIALLTDAVKKPRHPRQTFHRIGKGGKSQNHFTVDEERFTCALIFGETHRQIVLPRLSGGEVSCSFGSAVIDLSGCEEFAESCNITANCSFGELELQVPRTVRVEPESRTSFASVDIHGHPDPDPGSIIRLNANVSFGEIVIRYL